MRSQESLTIFPATRRACNRANGLLDRAFNLLADPTIRGTRPGGRTAKRDGNLARCLKAARFLTEPKEPKYEENDNYRPDQPDDTVHETYLNTRHRVELHDPKRLARRTTGSESTYALAAPDAAIGGIALSPESITVCLDFDERVLRMGFGTLDAVKALHAAEIHIRSV
jgi:hypothetical protein